MLTKIFYQFSRSSTDTLHLPLIQEDNSEKHDEQPHWHAFALTFVALPAVAGLIFENGSAVMTDILLLSLGCLFLYWSVKWPWQWYRAAQVRVYVDYEDEFSPLEDMSDEELISPQEN